MKSLIAALVIATVTLGLAGQVKADGLSFVQKQKIACKAIADEIMAQSAQNDSIKFGDKLAIHRGAEILCTQSYMQASADYPMKKAKKQAEDKAGVVAGVIVEMSYKAYAKDNGGAA